MTGGLVPFIVGWLTGIATIVSFYYLLRDDWR